MMQANARNTCLESWHCIRVERVLKGVWMQSCIHSVDQALECCNEIGYPVMLKASWGGGGKGIRKCMNEDDVRNSLKQVCILSIQSLFNNIILLEMCSFHASPSRT